MFDRIGPSHSLLRKPSRISTSQTEVENARTLLDLKAQLLELQSAIILTKRTVDAVIGGQNKKVKQHMKQLLQHPKPKNPPDCEIEESLKTPSIKALQIFCRLYEAMHERKTQVFKNQSLGAIAKEELGVTPSQVSILLQSLEEYVSGSREEKVQLIRRTAGSRKNEITADGQAFYRKAKKLLEQHSKL